MLLLLLLLLRLLAAIRSLIVVLLEWIRFLLRDNISSIGEVFLVIGEQIVLFGVYYRFHDSPCLFSFVLQAGGYYVHHFGDH